MERTRRSLWPLLAAAIWVLVAAGCGGAPAPGSDGAAGEGGLRTIRFSEVIRSIFYAPHYVALAKGFFREEGLQVDMVTAQGSDKGAAALLAGTADISLVGPETSVYVLNQGGGKRLKVFYQLTGTDGSFLVGRVPADSFRWEDLNGKTIVSWRPGSSPQMVLSHVLNRKGAGGAKVVTNVAPQAMVGAYEGGRGDFVQVYEPLATMLEQSGKGFIVASLGRAAGAFPETAYEATEEFIRNHPDVIQKWCNAVYKATRWMESRSPQEVAEVVAGYFEGTPKEAIAKSIERYQKQNTWPANPVLSREQFDILQNILVEAGTIKADQKVRYEDVVETAFAERVSRGSP
ncbi:MAG: ABC transporter substrate-binding protein [Alicyclobacillaceae bacterium]|nr:ABC transporter substrate-binding protein [Alicyclobacillaceae bacterium]